MLCLRAPGMPLRPRANLDPDKPSVVRNRSHAEHFRRGKTSQPTAARLLLQIAPTNVGARYGRQLPKPRGLERAVGPGCDAATPRVDQQSGSAKVFGVGRGTTAAGGRQLNAALAAYCPASYKNQRVPGKQRSFLHSSGGASAQSWSQPRPPLS